MEAIKRTKIVDVLKSEAFGTTVNVKGWVRTSKRDYFGKSNYGQSW